MAGRGGGRGHDIVGRGPRLHLRPLSVRDRSPFLRATRSSLRLHHPWIYPPTTHEAFRRLVAEGGLPSRQRLLSRSNSDDSVVGYFSLGEIARGSFKSAYLGYWCAACYVRQGAMREGMGLLLRHAFGHLKLHRLEANIQPLNGASIALVRKSGFRFEGFSPRYLKVGGRWRDHERWAMTIEDWQSLPVGQRRGWEQPTGLAPLIRRAES